jgi:lipoyl(octanoyl) transferase
MAICHVLRLGRVAYRDALDLQLRIVGRIKATETDDAALLLLEHDPVVTVGRSGTAEHLRASPAELARRGVELHEAGRGGDVTYHGPGQIVGYPIFRLPIGRRDVHRYLRSVEEAIIRAIGRYGLVGRRIPGLTGVWVGEAKVAAIGVAFSRWIAYHGFALNVTTDLAAFDLIVPCGIADRPVTSMEWLLGAAPSRGEVEDALVEEFVEEFAFDRARECPSAEGLPEWLCPPPEPASRNP